MLTHCLHSQSAGRGNNRLNESFFSQGRREEKFFKTTIIRAHAQQVARARDMYNFLNYFIMLTAILNPKSAKAQKFIKAYYHSHDYELVDCYETYSNAKYNAFKECRKRQYNENGMYGKIISHNQTIFTYAFITGTGLRVITPKNDYLIIGDFLPF